ncbi:MAG TPA: hypothetical protein DDW52_07885 [Planctomycetaceae bacterium]|nr:hypothetical protein [Planctomycetaceae bacterium]
MDGHALKPSEVYFSVIIPQAEGVARVDVSAQNWKEPPDDAIGWWKSRMPQAGPKKLRPAPTGVLLDTLGELVEMPGQEALAYFLGLLLVRRGVLVEESDTVLSVGAPDQTSEPSEEEQDTDLTLLLVCKADGRQWSVPICEPAAGEILAIEERLNDLLFTEE